MSTTTAVDNGLILLFANLLAITFASQRFSFKHGVEKAGLGLDRRQRIGIVHGLEMKELLIIEQRLLPIQVRTSEIAVERCRSDEPLVVGPSHAPRPLASMLAFDP